MSKGTLAFLALLVLGLAALWLAKERERAAGGPRLEEYALCPGLVVDRVRAVRIDDLQRGMQIKLERDAAGNWFLTDPVEYPAEGALVRTLLGSLEQARGELVPGVAPAEVDLDPPQVVLEIVQVEGQSEVTRRVELGRIDLDPDFMFARVPGHPAAAAPGGSEILRTTRSLANTLDRNTEDFRSHRTSGLLPQDVISLRRRGQVYLVEEGQRIGLDFDALLGPDGWKRVDAATVSLDPTAMGLLVRGSCEVAIERFADDSPTDLARYGLDAPVLTLELEGPGRQPVTLEFGHPPTTEDRPVAELTWYCQRVGFAHVWEVRTREVELLTRPADLFYDQNVVRVLRTDVKRIELEGGGHRLVFELDPRKRWSVWEEAAEGEAPRFPGDTAAIEAALAVLERSQLGEYQPGSRFEPAVPELSFALVLKNGARLGGRIGREARDEKTGAVGRQYLRLGDELVGLIDLEVVALCEKPLEEFRARKLHQIQESTVRSIELELEGRTFTYVNTGDNRWAPRGQSLGAPPGFLQSLDALLNLGAKRWLDPGAVPELEHELAVRIQPTDGEVLELSLGRTGDGLTVCRGSKGECAEIEAELYDRLRALF